MKKQIQQRDNTLRSTKGQQLELAMGASYMIPEDAPVRMLWEVLKGMKLTQIWHEGRISAANKLEKTAIWIFGAMNGIYSSRKLEEACRNDIRYMWLLEGKKVPDHTSLSRFRKDELSGILEEIFPQLLDYLKKTGETDEQTVFIDGTKIEANANRYSFVWRKSVEKQQSKLKDKAERLLENHTIEGLRTLASEMMQGITPVHGSGRRKSDEQKESEKTTQIADKLEQYQMSLDIMGEDRNSYSKTDHDATFMRMKDDHMRNGQLKAAYNLQLAVNSEYIVGYGVFSNRTDSGTLISLLDNMHGRYTSVTADAGYESLENYSYLEKNDIISYIKPTNYERRKRKSSWIGRLENMVYDADADSFTCKNNKTLRYDGMRSRKSGTGFERKTSLYVCTECRGCPLRQRCCRSTDESQKTLEVCWEFEEFRQKSFENITSETGILYRINRSIQVEGTFGILKQDWGFRRLLTRGYTATQTQLGLLAFAFNIRKLCAKQQNNRTKTPLILLDSA